MFDFVGSEDYLAKMLLFIIVLKELSWSDAPGPIKHEKQCVWGKHSINFFFSSPQKDWSIAERAESWKLGITSPTGSAKL